MSFDMHFIRVWIVYKVIILGPWIEGVDIFFPFYGSHFAPPPPKRILVEMALFMVVVWLWMCRGGVERMFCRGLWVVSYFSCYYFFRCGYCKC